MTRSLRTATTGLAVALMLTGITQADGTRILSDAFQGNRSQGGQALEAAKNGPSRPGSPR